MATKITNGGLSFSLTLDDTDFNKKLTAAESKILQFGKKAQNQGKEIESAFSKIGANLGGILTAAGIGAFIKQVATVRGEFQALEVAFDTMLGNKEKANVLMKEIVQTAATTPFDVRQIAEGAKQLLAYGTESDKVNDTLVRLGNIASGLSIPLNELIYLYGTTQTQGRLFTQDVRQFVGRGIPLVRELTKELGKTENEINEMVTAGKIGFPEVEKVIKKLTNQGGQFYQLNEKISTTIKGQISNLGDAWEQALNNIGKSNEGIIQTSISGVTTLVENYETVLKVLGVLITTYGAYRTALIATAAVQQIKNIAEAIQLTALFRKELGLATAAQQAFNINANANPYVLLATVIVALGASIYALSSGTDEATESQKALQDALAEVDAETAKQKAKIDLLTKSINDNSLSLDQRKSNLQKLINISPEHLKGLTLENLKTAEGKKILDDFNESFKENIRLKALQSQYEESVKRETEVKNNRGFTDDNLISVRYGENAKNGSGLSFAFGNEANKKLTKEKLLRDEKAFQDAILAQIDQTNKKIALRANNKEKPIFDKSLSEVEKQITDDTQALKDLKKGQLNYNSEKALLIKSINEAKARKSILEKELGLNTNSKATRTKADEIQPFGSLAYYQQLAQKFDTLLQKTPFTEANKEKIQKYQNAKIAADKKADEISKSISIQSFNEVLEEKKRTYALYEAYVQDYGKDTADTYFKNLQNSGNTYLDYLQKQIQALESKRTAGTAGKVDIDNLLALKTQITELQGGKTAIEQYKNGLDETKDKSASLTEYLQELNKELEKVSNDNSGLGIEKRKELITQIEQAYKERSEQLKQFVNEYQNSEAQTLAIKAKFNNLRAQLDKDYTDKSSTIYKQLYNSIAQAEAEELQKAALDRVAKSKEYEVLQTAIIRPNNVKDIFDYITATDALIKKLEAEAKKLQNNKAILEQIKKLKADKDQANENIKNIRLEQFGQIAAVIGQVGNTFEGLNGGVSEFGALLSNAASQAQNIQKAFSSNKFDVVMAGLQGIVTMIDIIASSAQQRREAEKQYYTDVINWQKEYNQTLFEQIRNQSATKAGIYDDTRLGKLKDGIQAAKQANELYKKSLGDLENAKIKVNQKNAIDGKAIGKGIGAGAAVGATVGTLFPVIGNVVGAIGGALIGGIAGLFGGTKKVDVFDSLLKQYPKLIKTGENGIKELDTALAQSLVNSNRLDEQSKSILDTAVKYQGEVKKSQEQIKASILELTGQLGDNLRNGLVKYFKDGSDALEAFKKDLNGVLETLITNKVYEAILKPTLDKFSKGVEDSFGLAGDDNIADDVANLYNVLPNQLDKAKKQIQEATDQIKSKFNIDLFSPNGTSSGASASSGAIIKNITEDTGTAIAGTLNGIQISVLQIVEQGKKAIEDRIIFNNHFIGMATSLGRIETNTGKTAENTTGVNQRLESIEKAINQGNTNLTNFARAIGR